MTIPFRLPSAAGGNTGLIAPLHVLLAMAAACYIGVAQAQTPVSAPLRDSFELRFRDLFATPVGPAGLELSDVLRQADGHTVRLVGYMVRREVPVLGGFLLTPRPVALSEHADGDADDLPPATVVIHLDASQRDWVVPHVRGLISVSGRLSVGRLEEPDGRISWIRLQLDPDAARSMNAFEFATYLHALQHAH